MDAGSNGVSRRDATIASLIAFAFGAVLTALMLVGSDVPLKCFEGGNIADWTAAIFTGLVGLGACWFAYEANQHRRDEVQKQERRERAARNSRLAVILHACATASTVESQIEAFKKRTKKEQNFARFSVLMRVTRKAINKHNWAGLERSLLDDNGIRMLNELEMRLLQFDDLAEEAVQDYTKNPKTFASGVAADIDILLKTGKQISTPADALTEIIHRIRSAP